MTRFLNRHEAGRMLATVLADYAGRTDVVVLALPRGGVPVGFEIAHALRAPLDIFVVRKLGVPGREELAMGAVASGGVRVVNADVVGSLGISDEALELAAAREAKELLRRERACRGRARALDVGGRTCIVVDDGLATGTTMRAGLKGLGLRGPASVVVAVPVASREACGILMREADEFVCLLAPPVFLALGEWYVNFRETTDDEVRSLLARARGEIAGLAAA